MRIAVIVSRFHEQITEKLLEGTEACFLQHGLTKKQWQVFWCPGAFELPQVAQRLAQQKKWDALICLGAVIRGGTPHFEYVSGETARGIQDVALKYTIPVVFGVLTTDTEQQALDRVGGSQGHKGWDAGVTAIEMAALYRSIKKEG
jgi:6,7-dimethyl-8-ribityllumazine synthase